MTPLRAVAALCLLAVAAIHLDKAPDYAGLGEHPLALSDQFYAQSAAAVALAVAVLALALPALRRFERLTWIGTALFALASLVPLVYSRYAPLPLKGFPGGFQETWDVDGDLFGLVEAYPSAVASGVAEALLLVIAASAAVRSGRSGRGAAQE